VAELIALATLTQTPAVREQIFVNATQAQPSLEEWIQLAKLAHSNATLELVADGGK
jgi:hypothetical protein